MSDQANTLRQLTRTAVPAVKTNAPGPPMIVVAGGKRGVGVTTVAVNLAAALIDLGQRAVLVDAAAENPAVARAVGVRTSSDHSLDDVLTEKCTATAALIQGPANIQILPRASVEATSRQYSRDAQQRFLTQLQTLGRNADVLVVDAGCGLTQWTRRFWQRARLVLVVTTADDAAILETYATIKRATYDRITTDVRVLANGHDREALAEGVQRRLSAACQQFLGHEMRHVPSVPLHGIAGIANPGFTPRLWEAPDSPFGHAVLWLGRAVSDVLATRADAGSSRDERFTDENPTFSRGACTAPTRRASSAAK
jgi:flagellar biosynthesis protein FlhG